MGISDCKPVKRGLKDFWVTFSFSNGQIEREALNFSYQTGKLAVSQRQGIVKLIPEKDADPNLIKNWRPLTLLNCDYKIASKAIANRINIVLPELISEDQSGSVTIYARKIALLSVQKTKDYPVYFFSSILKKLLTR